jgi:hypothetical protein
VKVGGRDTVQPTLQGASFSHGCQIFLFNLKWFGKSKILCCLLETFAVSNTGCKKHISEAESALTFGRNQLFEELSRTESKLVLLVQISSVKKEG